MPLAAPITVPRGVNRLPTVPSITAFLSENFVLVETGTTSVLLHKILGQHILFAVFTLHAFSTYS